jgi:hypothetical protein
LEPHLLCNCRQTFSAIENSSGIAKHMWELFGKCTAFLGSQSSCFFWDIRQIYRWIPRRAPPY